MGIGVQCEMADFLNIFQEWLRSQMQGLPVHYTKTTSLHVHCHILNGGGDTYPM